MATGGGDVEIEIDVVSDLLSVPFSRRNFTEKSEIVDRGRPKPKLGLQQPGKGCTRHFSEANYGRYKWLTASPQLNRLFCWDCLLFNSDKGPWNSTGYSNLSSLTKAANKHQESERHIIAAVHLKTFGSTRVDLQLDEQRRRETSFHNENVRKNREILKRLIDCVVFWGQQELPLRGHDEGTDSLNRGNYLELLSLLSEYDAELRHHLATATVFTGTSGKIQNDLINAIGNVLDDAINQFVKKERRMDFIYK